MMLISSKGTSGGRFERQRVNCALQTLRAFVVLALCSPSFAQNVRIAVLGLFHPREIIVRATPAAAVVVHASEQKLVLDPSSEMDEVHVHQDGNAVLIQARDREIRAESLTFTSRESGPIDFFLEIPGEITRRYQGTLDLTPSSGSLLAIVTMDLETAVASVIAAESESGTPLEALKAQAIAARSYLIASNGRHRGFDFCDTTHCQFLREPPKPDAAAARAAMASRGLVVEYRSQVFAAMYTRSCSGRTRTPADLGLPAGSYPYYSVVCRYCREHPRYWRSSISAQDTSGLRPHDEAARIATGRRLGWNRVESDDFTMASRGVEAIIEGVGQGHGIGLCQAGARAMAKEGADFRQILAHYYPNTVVTSLEQESADSGALSQIMSSQ
jgi:stage II sporulation protein D